MPIQILMPALSPTMTDGSLGKWVKKEGDRVRSGDVIAEIETDKATVEFEAVNEGTIEKILVPEGTQFVAVNTPIAIMLAPGEARSGVVAIGEPAADSEGTPLTKEAKSIAPSASVSVTLAPAPSATHTATTATGLPASGKSIRRVFSSPLARRVAKQAGIDFERLTGSGPNGRVILIDVENAKAGGNRGLRTTAAFEEIPLSNFRRVTARRLTEATQMIPHFYLSIDVAMDRLLALRAEINTSLERKGKISINDFVIRGAALALRKVPAANVSFAEKAIRLHTDVDISVAVATPHGLVTPIIRGADCKGLAQISSEMRALVARARANKLKPVEFQGGTFSISNLGMYGIRQFQAIINPPQGCVLAVGVGEERPVVRNGALAISTQMCCTLSVDHRIIDGAIAAEFLQALRTLIEEPDSILA